MKTTISIIYIFCVVSGYSQSEKINLDQAVQLALKNNVSIKAAYYEVESQKQLKKTSFDLPKTSVSLLYGQYNGYPKQDNNFTITQSIPFTAWGAQGSLNRSLLASSELKKATTENELVYQVKQVYHQLSFTQARRDLLFQQDSIYEGFLKSSSLRYKSGETNLLEQTTAETQRNEAKNQLRQNEAEINVLQTRLKALLNSGTLPEISESTLRELELAGNPDTTAIATNPSLAYMRQQVEVAHSQKKFENARFTPDLLIGYFNQTLIDVVNTENGTIANASDRFMGFQVGLSIPLWFVPYQSRAKAAEFSRQAAKSNYQHYQITLNGEFQQALKQYEKSRNGLNYYRTSALPNADLILKQSQLAFLSGEINYTEYLIAVRNAIGIKEGFLQTLNAYNQSILYIEYLSGNK